MYYANSYWLVKVIGDLNPFDVAEWTHNLPEWKDPDGSRIPIVVDDVLRFMGKTIEEIAAIRQEAAREAYLVRWMLSNWLG